VPQTQFHSLCPFPFFSQPQKGRSLLVSVPSQDVVPSGHHWCSLRWPPALLHGPACVDPGRVADPGRRQPPTSGPLRNPLSVHTPALGDDLRALYSPPPALSSQRTDHSPPDRLSSQAEGGVLTLWSLCCLVLSVYPPILGPSSGHPLSPFWFTHTPLSALPPTLKCYHTLSCCLFPKLLHPATAVSYLPRSCLCCALTLCIFF